MLNPPDTLKAPAFPYHDWPENVPPSQQLVALYLTLPSHKENVHRMVQLLKAGATAKDFRNHQHLGLKKLGNCTRKGATASSVQPIVAPTPQSLIYGPTWLGIWGHAPLWADKHPCTG